MAKILIVEDHDAIFDLMRALLKKKNHVVERVTDGSFVSDVVKNIKPDLIILDIMLPGLDGYSVQNKLLEDEETSAIPIVITTLKVQTHDIFQTARNVVGFISKPFEGKKFSDKIEEIVSAHVK